MKKDINPVQRTDKADPAAKCSLSSIIEKADSLQDNSFGNIFTEVYDKESTDRQTNQKSNRHNLNGKSYLNYIKSRKKIIFKWFLILFILILFIVIVDYRLITGAIIAGDDSIEENNSNAGEIISSDGIKKTDVAKDDSTKKSGADKTEKNSSFDKSNLGSSSGKDITPPQIIFFSPTPEEGSLQDRDATIKAHVRDNKRVADCVLEFDGVREQMVMIEDGNAVICLKTKTGLVDGTHSFTVIAADTAGNTISEGRTFLSAELFDVSGNMSDRKGYPVFIAITIRDNDGNLIFDNIGFSPRKKIRQGKYNITLTPLIDESIINMTFMNVKVDKSLDEFVDIEFSGEDIKSRDDRLTYNDIFSFNPVIDAEYDGIIYSAMADGPNLYKCSFFEFETQRCFGQWLRIRNDLTAGEVYTQLVLPEDPAFGEGSDKLVLRTIEIDGDFDDWDVVVDNANNVITDSISGSTNVDIINNANYDLTKFAYTWNETYLFMYFRRLTGPADVNMMAYLDLDNDGYMNATDKLAKFQWNGNSRKYDLRLSAYLPNGTVDILTGDGVDMPGSTVNETLIESNADGGSSDSVELEVKISWTELNLLPGMPFGFHISSARGSGSNLPSQVEDNLNKGSTLISDVDIFPDRVGGAKPGSVKTYTHIVKNTGNAADTFDITGSSDNGFGMNFSFINGTPLTDTDGSGIVDIGVLKADESVNITVEIIIGNISSGTEDITTIQATSSFGLNDTAIDETNIGDVTIIPSYFGRSANNSIVSYIHTIKSNLAATDVIDINAASNQNFSINVFFINGTLLADTNNNSKIDLGTVSPNEEINITIQIKIGDVPDNTVDRTTIIANSSSTPTLFGQVVDKTTVRPSIEIIPHHTNEIGIGSFGYYEHEVFNNQNITDIIDINLSSLLGWGINLFKADKSTYLSDTDADTIPDTGILGGQGGSSKIVVKVTVPMTAQENSNDLVTVKGFASASSASASAFDNLTARVLILYNNSARTQKDNVFVLGETVYAQAFGLKNYKWVIFYWVDANGTVVRKSPNINVDKKNQAIDEVITHLGDVPGTWNLILTDKQDREIVRKTFLVIEKNPPLVTNVMPEAGSEFNQSSIITIAANVTDDTGVDTVLAKISLPDSTSAQIQLFTQVNNTIYNGNFTQTHLSGNYSVIIIANDTFGNVNNSETTIFSVISDQVFIIVNSTGGVIYEGNGPPPPGVIPSGTYNTTIIPITIGSIINMTFVNHMVEGSIGDMVRVEQLGKQITPLDSSVKYKDTFAFDPVLENDYDYLEYTAIADGPNLYKCTFFDFDTQLCLGQWVRIRNDLVPEEAYTLRVAKEDPAFGEGSNQLVLRDINIDGDFVDWDVVLDSPSNIVADGISGSTDADDIQHSSRDLTKFAFTWNETYLFFYYRRLAGAPVTDSMLAYIDLDNDGYMNATDKLAKFQWNGNSRKYDLRLSAYLPNGTADILTGDGVDMPGNFAGESVIESNLIGGSEDKVSVEVRTPWIELNLSPGTPLKFHISSARGSGSNLPAQVEDNMGEVSTFVSDVDIFPNNNGGAKANSNKLYNHTVKNIGNSRGTFDISGSSDKGFTMIFSFANGTFLTDTDGTGLVDMGPLNPNQLVNITVNISIGSVPAGTRDMTTITTNSSLGAYDVITDITNIGDVAIFPGAIGRSANNSIVSYAHTVKSNLATTDVIDFNATSDQNFTARLFFVNGTSLSDTDGNTKIDVGNITPGEEINITVQIEIGNVPDNTVDKTTITATALSNPALSGGVVDKTTVRPPIEIIPDFTDEIGIGSFGYYEHEVFNNQNITDIIDINLSSLLGWGINLFKADKSTYLSDTDADTIPDTGILGGQGGSSKIVVKVTVPMTAQENSNDLVTVKGFASASSASASAFDNLTAQMLVIYNNSARTQKDDVFVLGETVYAKAYGLINKNKVIFRWLDGNKTVVRISPQINVDGQNQAIDEITINSSHILGNWTLVLTDTIDREITRKEFLVIEENPPLVTNVMPEAGSEFNQSSIITIAANVTDDTGVDTVLANISLPNSTVVQIELFDLDNDAIFGANFTETNGAGIYFVIIIANDTFGNVNNSETTIFQIIVPDNNPPQVFNLIPVAGSIFNVSNITEIAANVTDDTAVDMVLANITFPNGVIQELILTNAIGDKYNASFTIPNLVGEYTIIFFANDSGNNVNATETTTFRAVQIPINKLTDVFGVNISRGISGTLNESNLFSNDVEGGNKKESNLTAIVSTSKWQGYFGSVSEKLGLGIDSTFLFGFGNSSNNQIKTVFATPDNNFNFGLLQAAAVADVDLVWGFEKNDSDSVSSMFNESVVIAGVTDVPAIGVISYNNTGKKNRDTYKSGIFTDKIVPGNPIDFAFGVNVYQDERDFHNLTIIDYELIVPVLNGSSPGSTQTYYVYLDIE